MRHRYQVHPGSPWTAEAVARVIAHERKGLPIAPLPLPGTVEGRMEVLDAIAEHRVAIVLASHLDALGVDGLTAAVVRRLRDQMVTAGLRLEIDTNTVSSLLATAGIDHLIVKGAALAALVGLAPSQRGAGDVDIWVRPDSVAEAEAVLHRNRWSRQRATLPTTSDGWRWRLLMSVGNELPQLSCEASAVDLHWRLTQINGERIPSFDEAYQRSVRVPPLADTVRTLNPADALNHLAQHGRKDVWPTLRHVVDVARVADRCERREVEAMADRLPNVALALAVAELAVGVHGEPSTIDARTRRLAAEAWNSCLSLRNPLAQRSRAEGVQALATRARYEWWQVRSAPTWRARASWAYRLAVPLQQLVQPRTGLARTSGDVAATHPR